MVNMSRSASLFEDPASESRERLRRKLKELAREQLYLGTSSWKYEGWLGQIYTPERYQWHGRFSRKRFEEECLAEYAESFPIVCGDFSFYQFPTDTFWAKLFGNAPPPLQFALKVPEEITASTFPRHPRYGQRAGAANANFLSLEVLKTEFLDLLLPYRDRIVALIFEFGAFAKSTLRDLAGFVEALRPVIAGLPDSFRYGVEIRNAEFLAEPYFSLLRDHNVAHVFNAWTRMIISKQMRMEEAFTADFTLARALLRLGQKYENAVKAFSPYREVEEPNHEVREALRNLLLRAKQRGEPTYIFVNNRLEGNAPGTIEAIIEDL
jgi:uncharacterized protein YecE (DUF72 family)